MKRWRRDTRESELSEIAGFAIYARLQPSTEIECFEGKREKKVYLNLSLEGQGAITMKSFNSFRRREKTEEKWNKFSRGWFIETLISPRISEFEFAFSNKSFPLINCRLFSYSSFHDRFLFYRIDSSSSTPPNSRKPKYFASLTFFSWFFFLPQKS